MILLVLLVVEIEQGQYVVVGVIAVRESEGMHVEFSGTFPFVTQGLANFRILDDLVYEFSKPQLLTTIKEPRSARSSSWPRTTTSS